MAQIHEFKPVGLARKGRSRYLVINSTFDAARALLHDWPFDDGEAYFDAVKACLDTITAGLPAVEARKAFVLAALEAGLVIMETAPDLDS
ncbi:DUF982 domain-containing protein [Rhizobium sp. Root1220]|uniref:DUF982 domain-containing protein n=1 Tax=Rhizobium sp. Root1220 TaxID=1736432 RepID=UPI0006F98161|nr:DUF982 domain-containing protein [Rhizobium sp. Root1220]KQV65119.1 hypothetical protein ASC90_14560 [Rhizobium sp. Root1220]